VPRGESRDSFELAEVGRRDRKPVGDVACAEPEVVGTDPLAGLGEVSPDSGVSTGRLQIYFKDRKTVEYAFNERGTA
jgi:hypothetical protein